MKTHLQLILLLLIIFSFQVNGQISINYSDIWAVGDTIPRAVDTASTASPGNKGSSQVWDFSNAVPHVLETSRVINASSSPYSSSFPSANQAMTHDDSTYLYVNSNSVNVIIKGLVGDLLSNGTSTALPFNPAMVMMQFPEIYGSNYSSPVGFDLIGDGSGFGVYQIRVKHTATVFDSIDGWGTVTTPTGTYDCLRKKITEQKVDSSWYKFLPISPWTFDKVTIGTTMSYSWLAKETKLPVVELSFHPNGDPDKLTYSLIPPVSTNGIKLNSMSSSGFRVFPNPANDLLRFVPSQEFNTSTFEISIKNSLGQEVYKTTSSSTDGTTIDISSFPSGLYVIDAFRMNVQSCSHGIFSVAH